MPIDKIDDTKYFMPVNHPEQTQQGEALSPAVQDEEKSNAAKYMIGATALAATIAIGVIGHKNNWWKNAAKLGEKNSSKVNNGNSAHSAPVSSGTPAQPKPQMPSVQTRPTPQIQDSEVPGSVRQSRKKKQKQSKVKEFFSSPFRAIKNRRERIRIEKQQAAEAEARLQAQRQAEFELRQQQEAERRFQVLLDDEPNRLKRIAKMEQKYAGKIADIGKHDFGEVNVLPDDVFSNFSYAQAHPELAIPAPKRGEYTLKNFAVDGYWNGINGMGACSGKYIRGLPLDYNNQFVIGEATYENFTIPRNTHWGMQKAIVPGNNRGYHRGTVLRFNGNEFAGDRTRPLGWNIFIEGDISPKEMTEIKNQLLESGAWARQIAIQSNDTIIEVFNEIIKVLNR